MVKHLLKVSSNLYSLIYFDLLIVLGNVVHFAQAIEEVYEQLPLRLIDSDNIIVTERRENILNVKQFTVRPKLLFEALVWLKNSNHLYNNVEIIDRVESDYNINNIIVDKNIINYNVVEKNIPINEKTIHMPSHNNGYDNFVIIKSMSYTYSFRILYFITHI